MWALITVLQSIRENRELTGGVVWKAISDHWHTNMSDYIWWCSRLFLWKWAHPRLQTVNLHYIYLNHFISDQLARLNPQERFVQRKQTCRIAYFTPTWGHAFWYSPSVTNRRQEAAMVTCDVWGDVSSMTRTYISHYVRPGWHPHRCKRCVRWNLPMCDLWKRVIRSGNFQPRDDLVLQDKREKDCIYFGIGMEVLSQWGSLT